MAGHLGQAKTLTHLITHFYWPSLVPQASVGFSPLKLLNVFDAMQHLVRDTVREISESKSEIQYILNVQKYRIF